MLDVKTLSPVDIKNMSYNEIIGLVRETNRTPGGSKSVAYVTQMCGLKAGKTVLDIGTSTGITALELAMFSGCDVIGVDINENSLAEARSRAKKLGVDGLTKFINNDVTKLTFSDKTFDVVFCGNVTSLLDEPDKAFFEYARVLKDTGFLVAIPMYYVKKPSEELVKNVSNAIRVNIKPLNKDYWIKFFTRNVFERFIVKDFLFDYISDKDVNAFCDMILARPHLQEMSSEAFETLSRVYREYMLLFRDNLSIMGFSILILKKSDPEIEYELFTSHEI